MQNFNTLKTLLETQNLDFEVSIHDLEDGHFKPIYPNSVNNFYFFTNYSEDNPHNLKSLENCPNIVQNDFYCSLSHITSLKYGPQEAKNYVISGSEDLHSLQYCPTELEGTFNCANSAITSLEYSPIKVNGHYNCSSTKITSLEYAPLIVGVDFHCRRNKIKLLLGIGRKYLREIGSTLHLPDTIESNLLGLCNIKKMNNVTCEAHIKSGPLYVAIQIVNKHLQTDGDECMEELIQNGYKDYAKF